MRAIRERALADAMALGEGGCDAVLVENFGDVPFHAGSVPPETVAAMALCLEDVSRSLPGLPVGVNVLRNDVRSALALCASGPASFVRVNVHTGAAHTDQGYIQGRAAETLRERARLCPDVAILADAHVKHATPAGQESIADASKDLLERGLADALIVTGKGTGSAPDPEDLSAVRAAAREGSILVGSGLTDTNAEELLAVADGAIVGTWFKLEGRVEDPVDGSRVRALRQIVDAVRRRP